MSYSFFEMHNGPILWNSEVKLEAPTSEGDRFKLVDGPGGGIGLAWDDDRPCRSILDFHRRIEAIFDLLSKAIEVKPQHDAEDMVAVFHKYWPEFHQHLCESWNQDDLST